MITSLRNIFSPENYLNCVTPADSRKHVNLMGKKTNKQQMPQISNFSRLEKTNSNLFTYLSPMVFVKHRKLYRREKKNSVIFRVFRGCTLVGSVFSLVSFSVFWDFWRFICSPKPICQPRSTRQWRLKIPRFPTSRMRKIIFKNLHLLSTPKQIPSL